MSASSGQQSMIRISADLGLDACVLKGFKYAGLEYGGVSFIQPVFRSTLIHIQECWCFDSISSSLQKTIELECQMRCTGDNTYRCGAGYRLSVYSAGTATSLTFVQAFIDYSLQGCFEDSVSSRVLSSRIFMQDSALTVEKCINACSNAGYGMLRYSTFRSR